MAARARLRRVGSSGPDGRSTALALAAVWPARALVLSHRWRLSRDRRTGADARYEHQHHASLRHDAAGGRAARARSLHPQVSPRRSVAGSDRAAQVGGDPPDAFEVELGGELKWYGDHRKAAPSQARELVALKARALGHRARCKQRRASNRRRRRASPVWAVAKRRKRTQLAIAETLWEHAVDDDRVELATEPLAQTLLQLQRLVDRHLGCLC